MIRALPLVKAVASAAVLAALGPAATGMKAVSPAPATATTPAATYTIKVNPNKPAVERLPGSRLAWEFDREPDGTSAIKGPGGTIWHGNLGVSMGPFHPQRLAPNMPGYRITIPNGNGRQKYYQIVPPGQAKPSVPLPKPTP